MELRNTFRHTLACAALAVLLPASAAPVATYEIAADLAAGNGFLVNVNPTTDFEPRRMLIRMDVLFDQTVGAAFPAQPPAAAGDGVGRLQGRPELRFGGADGALLDRFVNEDFTTVIEQGLLAGGAQDGTPELFLTRLISVDNIFVEIAFAEDGFDTALPGSPPTGIRLFDPASVSGPSLLVTDFSLRLVSITGLGDGPTAPGQGPGNAVPLPGTLPLALAGLGLVGGAMRLPRRSALQGADSPQRSGGSRQ